ncbi:DUF6362 family protein [Chelatococcus asaccharovorans]|nr:DUF6362 family protein [Chelatococcus asaccharovorans]MBS7703280.1 hypothetical protein [Chelatococcus asaccharovorans]
MQVTTWTPGDVLLRFIEAADTERRLPVHIGPAGYRSQMPEVLRETWADANSQEETREKQEWHQSLTRLARPKRDAIRRAEEAADWHIRYLDKVIARTLWRFCFCRIFGTSFQDVCRARGWVPRTAYRRLEKGLKAISDGLNQSKAGFESADLDHLASLGLIDPDSLAPDASPKHWSDGEPRQTGPEGLIYVRLRRTKRDKKKRKRGKRLRS